MILLLILKFYQLTLQKLHTIYLLLGIQIQGNKMQVHNASPQNISISEQAAIRSAELREQREINQEVNNEQTQRIQEEVNVSSITGLGGSLNLQA